MVLSYHCEPYNGETPQLAAIPQLAPTLTTLCLGLQEWHAMGALVPAVLSRLARELKELTKQPCEGIRVSGVQSASW